MTQKELLYLEDAYKHEEVIEYICNEMLNLLEDDELISFIEKELKSHTSIKEKILNYMEDKSNE